MAQMKLEEELWKPTEEHHREFKKEAELRDAEWQMIHFKEEPEEVEIKAEPLEIPLIHESVKREEESPSCHPAVKEESRDKHGENSSDTDDSEDWAPSAERPDPQTHTEGNKEESWDSESSFEFDAPTTTSTRTKKKMEENPTWVTAGQRPPSQTHPEVSRPPHQHRRRNRGSLHPCPYCGSKFCTMSQLRLHISSHTGEKPFKCTVCDKSFVQNHNLNQHMKTHTGERPHKCPVCVRSFSRRNNLYQHMKLHTGKRSFKCSTCERSFTHMSSLYQLLKAFTDTKLFQCKTCSGATE